MKSDSNNLDNFFIFIKKFIPTRLFKTIAPLYHFILSNISAVVYRFPGKRIHIIAITGTKGKSSTTEYVNAVLESAGYKTAILSTIRFKIGDDNSPNRYKMTMPGRFFVQRFLNEAVKSKCQFAIIEMTSEGARNWRHLWTFPDTLIFTNLTPEHIESHGSFENYLKCKLRLAKAVENSGKPFKRIIANISNKYGAHFLIYDIDKKIPYHEEDSNNLDISLLGDFNKVNAYNAYLLGKELNISEDKILSAIKSVRNIPGRIEQVMINNQKIIYETFIDYAHTVESMEKLYEIFSDKRIIHVFGSDGGGRDKAKRPLLGKLADEYCYKIILTEENPYNDNNKEIMNDIKQGINTKKTNQDLFIIDNRKKAIAKAIELAKEEMNQSDIIILITGKGSEPYIVRANNQKEEWSDYNVAKELMEK